MKIKLNDIACFETHTVPDPETCGNCLRRTRGWWLLDGTTRVKGGRFLGHNRQEAADELQMLLHHDQTQTFDVI